MPPAPTAVSLDKSLWSNKTRQTPRRTYRRLPHIREISVSNLTNIRE